MKAKAPTIDAFVRGPTLFPQGVAHHANLLVGDPVMLIREPDNPKDSNAVACLDKDENGFGYIQRDKAATLALWMDKGWLYLGKIIVPAKITHDGNKKFVHPDTLVVRCTPVMPMKKAVNTRVSITSELDYADSLLTGIRLF